MTRRVGVYYGRGDNRLPTARLRWRRGDRPPELYISTPHVRFWIARHEESVEFSIVRWRKKRHGEAAAIPAGWRWLTETWHAYTYDGASGGEWIEDRS